MPQKEPRYRRTYIPVVVDVDQDGHMKPLSLEWKGVSYEIDSVSKDVRPSYAEKSGGQGDRYKIKMNGEEKYLFFEHNADYGDEKVGKWFVERKIAP